MTSETAGLPAGPATRRVWVCAGRTIPLDRTAVMGILNVTPDSFSDGGRWAGPEGAAEHGRRLEAEGAAVVDLGGQSTRPGHAEVEPKEEIARVVPVLERLVPSLSVPVSIDTYKPAVARAALRAGAHLVNDEHGFQGDPEMARLVAEFGCPAILMHWDRGFPQGKGDPVGRVKRFLERSLEIARQSGIDEGRVVLDPGIGFFKTPQENLEILRRMGELKSLGRPLLVGVSRKSVIGYVLGGGPAERLEGTLATTVLAAVQGVELVRVHDVLANARALKMAEAVLGL